MPSLAEEKHEEEDEMGFIEIAAQDGQYYKLCIGCLDGTCETGLRAKDDEAGADV